MGKLVAARLLADLPRSCLGAFMKMILVVAVLAGAPLRAEDVPAAVTLQGRVVDARTGEPIAKAVVTVKDQASKAVTDAGGRFALADVRAGEVEVVVTTVGYGITR